jgi:hypothetical protein
LLKIRIFKKQTNLKDKIIHQYKYMGRFTLLEDCTKREMKKELLRMGFDYYTVDNMNINDCIRMLRRRGCVYINKIY